MKKILVAILLALACGSSLARNGVITAPGNLNANIGLDFLSAGSGDLFINYIKSSSGSTLGANNTPDMYDDDGYPNSAVPQASAFTGSVQLNNVNLTDQWVLAFDGTGANTSLQGGDVISVIGSCGLVGNGSLQTLTMTGTNCSATFTFTFTGPHTFTWTFPTGKTYSGMKNFRLYRVKDQQLLNSNFYWTPEFLSAYRGQHPSSVRPMTFNIAQQGNDSVSLTNAATFPQVSNVTWSHSRYPAKFYAGLSSGTDQYTFNASPSTPATWTEGELTIAKFQTTSGCPIAVSGAVDNGSGLIRLTVASTATLLTGEKIYAYSVGGVTGISGAFGNQGVANPAAATFLITVIDGTHVDLQGSTFAGTYTSGGFIEPNWFITGTANNGSGAIRLTIGSTACITTNQNVLVMNLSGTAEANGVWAATVVDGTHVDLQGSTFTNAFSAATLGQVSTSTVDIKDSNGNSRGAKFMASYNAFPVTDNGGGSPNGALPHAVAGTLASLRYDKICDWVLYDDLGITLTLPLAAQAQLANALNVALWYNIPWQITDDGMAMVASFFRDNLTQYLPGSPKIFWELGNEQWNFAFPNTNIGQQRGIQLGFAVPASGINLLNYWALRFRQLSEVFGTNWAPRTLSDVVRMKGFQTSASPAGMASVLQGTLLTGVGNAKYAAKIGINYDAWPNRPMDYADGINIAFYFGGVQGFYQTQSYADLCNPTPTCTTGGIIKWAADYATGNPALMDAALASMDNDTRAGTTATAGVTNNNAITTRYDCLLVGQTCYPDWNTMLAGLNCGGNTPCTSPLKMFCYEGGETLLPPTAAQLTAKGDGNAAVDAPNISSLIQAYWNSPLLAATVVYQNTRMIALSQSGTNCAGLVTPGTTVPATSEFSMMNSSVVSSTGVSMRMNYYGAAKANLPYLLNRDLNPASNDNSPAWLDKAA